MNSVATAGDLVVITVELFGMARVRAAVNHVPLEIDARAPVSALLSALAHECPELVGSALFQSDEGAVGVADGYALNRNGLAFLSLEPDAPIDWRTGDSLLILSNQAGG